MTEPSIQAEQAASSLPVIGAALMLALQAAAFMVSAEARVIAPLLPAIAADFGTTVPAAGLLISAYAIPYGLFQLVYGPLADRFSRQRVIGVAISLFAVGTLVSGFAPSLSTLTLLRLITGGAAAGVIPVVLAYVGDAVPYTERQATLGRVVSVTALGSVLSAALGGIIATWLSWRALFFAYGLLALLVGAILLRLPVQRARPDRERRSWFSPYRDVFRYAGAAAAALYGLVFFEGFAATSTAGYLGALLFERDHLDYATIGLLLTLYGVASMITARLVGKLVRRLGEGSMVRLGGSLLVASYLLVWLEPYQVFFPLAMLISGTGFVIAHSTLQTRATELAPALRGTAVAMFAFALFLGGGLGTAVAGLAIEHSGYVATIIGTAAFLAVFAAVGGPALRVGRRRHSTEGTNL